MNLQGFDEAKKTTNLIACVLITERYILYLTRYYWDLFY